MDVTGKVVAVLQPEVFKGRNGDVTKNGFVIETGGRFSKRLKFDVLNLELWNKLVLREGLDVNVSFDAESREWNGRWFTSLLCYRCLVVAGGGSSTSPSTNQSQSESQSPSVVETSQQKVDDLPF